jgi:hypothetical protein
MNLNGVFMSDLRSTTSRRILSVPREYARLLAVRKRSNYHSIDIISRNFELMSRKWNIPPSFSLARLETFISGGERL